MFVPEYLIKGPVMLKKLKFVIYSKLFIHFAYHIIRLYSLSFRLKVENESEWEDRFLQGDTILLCAWHQQFFSAIRYFKKYSKYNPGLMISQSKDGDLIAGVAQKTGWHTARGSSSRGGKKAMQSMIEHLTVHKFGAHILDGPRGPRGKVKAGIVKMATTSNAVVVPFYTHAEKAWYFNSWDRFMLPKPFSRVTLIFGEAIHMGTDIDRSDFEKQRLQLEETMKHRLIHPLNVDTVAASDPVELRA